MLTLRGSQRTPLLRDGQRALALVAGTITGVQSGLCLDASGQGTANGTSIMLWACGAGTNRRWSLR